MLNYKFIGRRIKEIRKIKKISQADLAELTDLSVSYICYIENGKKKASLDSLVSISNIMEVSLDSLLYGNQSRNKDEYQNEILILIKDCSTFEKAIIYEMIYSFKDTLRDNICLLKMDDEYIR